MRPDGAPIKPLAKYQSPTRKACSSRLHQEEVRRTYPGVTQASKIPINKQLTESVAKFVADALAASVAPKKVSEKDVGSG